MTINLTPDFDLYLWILFIITFIKSIMLIIVGLAETEKSQKYDIGDSIMGAITIILLIIILVR